MDTTQRCRTCKHWDKDSDCASTNTGICNHKSVGEEVGDGIHTVPHSDGDWQGEAMRTGPDFGCVHWCSDLQ